MPVIGVLSQLLRQAVELPLTEFHAGLKEEGFFEGRNLAIEYRWGDGSYDKIPAFAADLVQKNVAAIFTGGPWNVRTLQALTKTIPIVFSMGEDPVKLGIVAKSRASRRQRDRPYFLRQPSIREMLRPSS